MQPSFLLSYLSLLVFYVGAYFSNGVVVPPLPPIFRVFFDHDQLNQSDKIVSGSKEHDGEGKKDGYEKG